MLPYNSSCLSTEVSDFILNCFVRSPSWQHWLSLPLSILFLVAMGANAVLLITIQLEASLHEPMYYLLGLLSLLDIVLCLTVIPKVLAIFWFDLRSISFSACFLQMFIMNNFQPRRVQATINWYILLRATLSQESLDTERLAQIQFSIIFFPQ